MISCTASSCSTSKSASSTYRVRAMAAGEGTGRESGAAAAVPLAALPGSVQKETLVQGSGTNTPQLGDELAVQYMGALADGSKFCFSGGPVKLTLGKGEVVKGFELGVATMTKGESARLTVQPQHAYGARGLPPDIPPNATLTFEVELISWRAPGDLCGDGGCVKSTVREGKVSGSLPSERADVRISTKVSAEKGDVVEDRRTIDYTLGSGALGLDIGPLVDQAVREMRRGEMCMLKCRQDYIFKGAGHGSMVIELTLLELYSERDVSMLGDGTVMKKTIKEGRGEEAPDQGWNVVLRVDSATDADGVAIPGFTGQKELSFRCCEGDVCDAIEGAARSMKRHEQCLVTCKAPWKVQEPKLGLGKVSFPEVVLGLTMVSFSKVEDNTLPETIQEQWEDTIEERIELALNRKEVASKLFKAKRFEMALDAYNKVFLTLGRIDQMREDLMEGIADLILTLELNKAACFLQLNDPSSALASANKVLQADCNNVKALFRRAKALHGVGQHLEAVKTLERLVALDKSNTEAKALIPVYRQAHKAVAETSAEQPALQN